MNLSLPANVILVLNQIQSISSFNILPVNTLFSLLFYFTETKVPGVGFVAMGVESTRLILNLNSFFFYYVIFGIIILVYFVLLKTKDRHAMLPRLIKKIE